MQKEFVNVFSVFKLRRETATDCRQHNSKGFAVLFTFFLCSQILAFEDRRARMCVSAHALVICVCVASIKQGIKFNITPSSGLFSLTMIRIQDAAIAVHRCSNIVTRGLFKCFQQKAITMKVSSRNSKEHAHPAVEIYCRYG